MARWGRLLVVVGLVMSSAPAAHATTSAPPFDDVSVGRFCGPYIRCTATANRRTGAFAVRSQFAAPARRRGTRGGYVFVDLPTALDVTVPSGRVDVDVHVDGMAVTTASSSGSGEGILVSAGVVAWRTPCPPSTWCSTAAYRNLTGDFRGSVDLHVGVRDTFDRDLPPGTVHVSVRAMAAVYPPDGTRRALAAVRAERTTVDMTVRPVARHEFVSRRYVARPGGLGTCGTVGDVSVGGACVGIPAGASFVAAWTAPDGPSPAATRVRVRDTAGGVLAETTSACAATTGLLWLPASAASVVVEPITGTDCIGPPVSGTVTADFTIPPP
jgi:hypothetical protein